MRRPAAVCAAGFTAGIAVCEEAGGYSFLLSAAGFLLLFLLNKCKNIEKNKNSNHYSQEYESRKKISIQEKEIII